MRAGKLRHQIRIEAKTNRPQDQATGEIADRWRVFGGADRVPAEIAPLSGREFIAAQSIQGAVNVRIKIRFREGITAAMRAVNVATGVIYNIAAPLPDPGSGREWLTLMCSTGVNRG